MNPRAAYHKEWYEKNKERISAAFKEHYKKNKAAYLARTNVRGTAHYYANKETELAKNKIYREANKERIAAKRKLQRNSPEGRAKAAAAYAANREKIRVKRLAWNKSHLPEMALACARRKARKLMATPVWANQVSISQIYNIAAKQTRETGIQYSIDHIVPLKHSVVCGLHCEDNLQILTKSENSSKNNWFVVE